MRVLAIAETDLRRLLRWRPNLFFLVVLPLLLILLLGAAFGGSGTARIGVIGGAGGPLARAFVADLDARPATTLVVYRDPGALARAVARGRLDAGVVLPAAYDRALQAGRDVRIRYLARPDSVAAQLRATVVSAAAEQSTVVAAARLVGRRDGLPFAAALARARAAAARTPPVEVRLTAPDGSRYAATTGRFESGASTQLLLFVFLNSLNGAAWMIETRRLGIARRILSTPTSPWTLIAGQVAGRLVLALFQALVIVVGSFLLFGVHWGDPAGAAAVVLAFCLVGTGAGVLLGSLAASTQQAQPVAILLGLGLAALGGSMVPLEVFPRTVRAIAHLTPHAWGNDAFSKLLQHGGGLASVLPQVGVLLAFAAVTLGLAGWRLRRVLTA